MSKVVNAIKSRIAEIQTGNQRPYSDQVMQRLDTLTVASDDINEGMGSSYFAKKIQRLEDLLLTGRAGVEFTTITLEEIKWILQQLKVEKA